MLTDKSGRKKRTRWKRRGLAGRELELVWWIVCRYRRGNRISSVSRTVCVWRYKKFTIPYYPEATHKNILKHAIKVKPVTTHTQLNSRQIQEIDAIIGRKWCEANWHRPRFRISLQSFHGVL